MLSVVCFRFPPHLVFGVAVHPPSDPSHVQLKEWSHEPRIHPADELVGPIPYGLDDGGVEACEPAVYVALHEDHFGVRVGRDEIFGEASGRDICDGGVVAEELIPFLSGEFGTFVEKFGVESRAPHGAIWDAAVEGERVKTWEAQDVEG